MQAFLATCFTWGVTALGAASVFTFKGVRGRDTNGWWGFAAGGRMAASFWCRLARGTELGGGGDLPPPLRTPVRDPCPRDGRGRGKGFLGKRPGGL